MHVPLIVTLLGLIIANSAMDLRLAKRILRAFWIAMNTEVVARAEGVSHGTQKPPCLAAPIKRSDKSSIDTSGSTCAGESDKTPSTATTSADTDNEQKIDTATTAATSPLKALEISYQIGHGSFGTVFYGSYKNDPVAVKVIRWSSGTYKRASCPMDEAMLASKLEHPFLVKTITHVFIDHKEPNGEAVREIHHLKHSKHEFEIWMVQQWCDRGTLRNYCTAPRFDESSLEEVEEILSDITSAGAFLHANSIVHGDLTGNNVLLDSSSSKKGYDCKICDFGMARILDENMELFTTQLGTVSHMPPELFQVDKEKIKLTPKADIYALGILMWVAITGAEPWPGMTAPQIVIKVARGGRMTLPPEIPEDWQCMYTRCTDFNPSARPTFDELRDALSRER